MLTITHPQIVALTRDIPIGLVPFRKSETSRLGLILKCTKEQMLTAKLRGGFRCYLAPISVSGFQSHGLITAFFDDYDEPLVVRTILIDDEGCHELLEVLSQDTFDVHFFDEHHRELLAYQAHNSEAENFKSHLEKIKLGSPEKFQTDPHFLGRIDDEVSRWFGDRGAIDEQRALTIALGKPLFPEDIFIDDARPEVNSYHGRQSNMHASLQREDAGHFGELDIVGVLLRTFGSDEIFLNPVRPDNGREFSDVLVVASNNVLIIQAKDSPNTEQTLERSIERKKLVVRSHLRKAAKQLRGSISYAKSHNPLKIATAQREHEIDLTNRSVFGLIVTKELFSDEYAAYSSLLFDLVEDTEIPCFAFDYPELSMWTTNLRTENEFVSRLVQIFNTAVQYGEFTRLRLWLTNPSMLGDKLKP